MARTSEVFVCLLLCGISTMSRAVAADSTDAAESVDSNLAKAIISARLGVQITVAEAHQINLRPRTQGFRGGLVVVLLSGPLAKAADLRLGDVIVKIDHMEIRDLGTALDALQKADDSDEKTRLAFVRGGQVMQTRIMVGPTMRQTGENSSKEKIVGPNDALSLQRYLEKSQLLTDEQQELERLEKANEVQRIRLRLMIRQMELYERQAAQMQQSIENAPLGARRDALVAQQSTFEAEVERVQKQILNSKDESIPEQIESRNSHVRVLEQSLEKSVLELRLACRLQRDKD